MTITSENQNSRIIKAALSSNIHMQEILTLGREKFHLFQTIYLSFSSTEELCNQFNLAVDSYLLVKQLWSHEIPRTSEYYGDGPRKRKVDDERLVEELLATEPYKTQLYTYFCPKPPVLFPLVTHRTNSNLQHQAGQYQIEYDMAAEGREKCKKQISEVLKNVLPRKMIRDHRMLYTSCCRNGHQICVECAMKIQNKSGDSIPDCPLCKQNFEVEIFDPDDRKSGNMFLGPVLYLKFFKFRIPFYITITSGLYDRFHPTISHGLISDDGIFMSDHDISEVNSFVQQDHAVSQMTNGRISGDVVLDSQYRRTENVDYVNDFDIQCHENAKVRVNLYTACTMIQGNFTLHVRLSHSPLQFTRNDQMVKGKWKQVDVPRSSENFFELDGNVHHIIDDRQFVFQRWNTRVEIEFRNKDGYVIQAAVVNIDKRPHCRWMQANNQLTESRACTINQELSQTDRSNRRHRWYQDGLNPSR